MVCKAGVAIPEKVNDVHFHTLRWPQQKCTAAFCRCFPMPLAGTSAVQNGNFPNSSYANCRQSHKWSQRGTYGLSARLKTCPQGGNQIYRFRTVTQPFSCRFFFFTGKIGSAVQPQFSRTHPTATSTFLPLNATPYL